MMYAKKGKKIINRVTTIQSKTKAAMNSSRPMSNPQKAPSKLKKNSSENAFIKTKITNLEQNMNDQERILKNILQQVNNKEKDKNYQEPKLPPSQHKKQLFFLKNFV